MPKAAHAVPSRRIPAAAQVGPCSIVSAIVRVVALATDRSSVLPLVSAVVRAVPLAVVLTAGPARAQTPAPVQAPAQAQDYRPNPALGAILAKKPFIETKTNPGGKGILDNSCIYKDSFSLSPSEVVLDRCDVAGATARFTAQNGPPDQASDAAGGKKLLEYRLLHNENSYLVKVYFSCAQDKTEQFVMVECKKEKNRAKPGRPPDERPFWKKLSPF